MLYCITMFIYHRPNSEELCFSFFVRLSFSALLLLLSGCGPFDDPLDLTYTVDAPGGLPCTAGAWGRTTCTARIKEYENAYIVFTNPSTSESAPSAPRVLGPSSGRMAVDTGEPGMNIIGDEPGPEIIDLRLWETDLPLERESFSSSMLGNTASISSGSLELGSPHTFRNPLTVRHDKPKNPTTIPAKLRAKVEDKAIGVTLLIYVADDYWIDKPGTGVVNQTMVNAVADQFLKDGANNDIYDWVTNLYGKPWGDKAGGVRDVLKPDAAKHITILIDDIFGDGKPTRTNSPRTVGYFSATNNFLSHRKSNRRLMFVMDAALLAAKDPGASSWSPRHSWPQDVFSTLAHEFHHMVSFYQKRVTNRLVRPSETWLEEMSAMVTEDLISDKLGLPGPRGVPLENGKPDYSPGKRPVSSARLSAYNSRSGISFINWGQPSAIISYGVSYAFGAYLARNYGGAALFREIVRNEYNDEQAVLEAIKAVTGKSKTFGVLLADWGAASIKSDNPTPNVPTYNFGGTAGRSSRPENAGSVEYTLGSINLHNYRGGKTNSGRFFYGPVPFYEGRGMVGHSPYNLGPAPPASNLIFQVGQGLSQGVYHWDVELPEGMTAQVVTRREVSYSIGG